ncbi:MAG: hypothetical protein KDA57_12535 [Planctomycetales bacterium]|nr:hypothetical protein [Planctomycetales bacterium]
MRRFMTFLLGMVTGAILLLGAMKYHVVRAQDGFHVVPKKSPNLAATYVDIRGFTVADWAEHAEIAASLMNAGKGELMSNSASEMLHNQLDRLLNRDGQP